MSIKIPFHIQDQPYGDYKSVCQLEKDIIFQPHKIK